MDVLALFARVAPSFLHVLATVAGESTVPLSCMEHVRVTVPPEYTGSLEDMDSSIAASGTAWADDIEKRQTFASYSVVSTVCGGATPRMYIFVKWYSITACVKSLKWYIDL